MKYLAVFIIGAVFGAIAVMVCACVMAHDAAKEAFWEEYDDGNL
jgi:hypothetical protein